MTFADEMPYASDELPQGAAVQVATTQTAAQSGTLNTTQTAAQSDTQNDTQAAAQTAPQTTTPRQATVIALFGGSDKGTELDDLASVVKDTCKYAVCYGEAGERFFKAISAVVPSVKVDGFEQAFYKAVEKTEPGDTVLLSPACASFDEFPSFEARGAAFKALVDSLARQKLGTAITNTESVNATNAHTASSFSASICATGGGEQR
jgi:hypothetical protein